jgi:hypothetical protein
MDLLEATQTSLTRKVGNEDCTFSFLTAYDRAELLRTDLAERKAAWKAERAELVENLKAAGIEGPQAFQELESYRERCPQSATETDWIMLANDPTREVAIFTASLKPVHGEKAEELAKRARLSLSDKAVICGLSVVAPEKSEAQETTDPNSDTAIPNGYGTPATTSTGSAQDA